MAPQSVGIASAEEEQFRLMVEAVRDYAIFMLDPDGRVVSWNAGAERIKGYRAAEIIGRPFTVFYPAEDLDRDKPGRELAEATAVGRVEDEGWRLRKDGSRFFAHVVITALRNPDGRLRGFAKVTRDITERMRSDEAEALRDTDERFRATFEQAAVGIAHVGLDGRWIQVNRKLCEIVGYACEDLLRLTFQEITHPDDLGPDLQYLERLLSGEISTYAMEKRYITRAGSCTWVNLTVALVRATSGEPKYFISVVEDIAERKAAEEALRRYAARLRTLHEVDGAILQARSAEEVARAALAALVAMFPCQFAEVLLFDAARRQAVVVTTLSDGVLPGDVGEVFPLDHVGDTGGWIAERVIRIADIRESAGADRAGSRLAAVGIRAVVRLPLVVEGQVIGVLDLAAAHPGALPEEHGQVGRELADQLAIAIEQARLRERLRGYTEELERTVERRTAELSEAVKELEAFAYSVSHDLRAPLRALQGLTQALIEDYADQFDETGRDYAARIVASARRMDALILDLLAYSRLNLAEIRNQPVALEGAVADVLEHVQNDLSERGAEVEVQGPLPAVLGHRPTLVQVITNLIGNAVKFVGPGVAPRVRVRAVQERGLVVLWVEDNGIGIAPQHRERVFRVFERLHGVESYPGTGIGLAIVRKGVERMGGRVGFESEPGRGSRFWVELPAAEEGS